MCIRDRAYKDWERIHGKEKKLPGIPLTMDQLVFVSHGQVKNHFILFHFFLVKRLIWNLIQYQFWYHFDFLNWVFQNKDVTLKLTISNYTYPIGFYHDLVSSKKRKRKKNSIDILFNFLEFSLISSTWRSQTFFRKSKNINIWYTPYGI